MLIKEPLDFAKEFINSVNQCIETEHPGKKMSRHQQWWLAFCITAVVLTNSVCWAQFERISLGKLTLASISWMFRRSKLRWEQLLMYHFTVFYCKLSVLLVCANVRRKMVRLVMHVLLDVPAHALDQRRCLEFDEGLMNGDVAIK